MREIAVVVRGTGLIGYLHRSIAWVRVAAEASISFFRSSGSDKSQLAVGESLIGIISIIDRVGNRTIHVSKR